MSSELLLSGLPRVDRRREAAPPALATTTLLPARSLGPNSRGLTASPGCPGCCSGRESELSLQKGPRQRHGPRSPEHHWAQAWRESVQHTHTGP